MSEGKLRQVLCPRCRKSTDWYDNPHRPFCSERCKLIDLGEWADEAYRIKGEPVEDGEKDREKDGETEKPESDTS